MGVILDLSPSDGSTIDVEIIHDGISRSFMDEIISPFEGDYLNLDLFLTKEEQNILYPNYDDFKNSDFTEHDPVELKIIFKKIHDYLKANESILPLNYWISTEVDGAGFASSSEDFELDDLKWCLSGFHNNLEHRNEIEIWCRGSEKSRWIQAKEKISIGDKVFHIRPENKFEFFKDLLLEFIAICESAANNDKKLYWTFSN